MTDDESANVNRANETSKPLPDFLVRRPLPEQAAISEKQCSNPLPPPLVKPTVPPQERLMTNGFWVPSDNWPTVMATGSVICGLFIGTVGASFVRTVIPRVIAHTILAISLLGLVIVIPNFVGASLLFARRASSVAWLRVGSLATLLIVFSYELLSVFTGLPGGLRVYLFHPFALLRHPLFTLSSNPQVLPAFWALFIFLWLRRPAIKQQIQEQWNQSRPDESGADVKTPISFSPVGAIVGGVVGAAARAGAAFFATSGHLGNWRAPVPSSDLISALAASALLGALGGAAAGAIGRRWLSTLVGGALFTLLFFLLQPRGEHEMGFLGVVYLGLSFLPMTLPMDYRLRWTIPSLIAGLIAGAAGGAAAQGSKRFNQLTTISPTSNEPTRLNDT